MLQKMHAILGRLFLGFVMYYIMHLFIYANKGLNIKSVCLLYNALCYNAAGVWHVQSL